MRSLANSKSESLRIAQVVPLWTSVPPAHYGGIELITHYLVRELIARGHKVTLFGSGDSKTGAELHAVCDENMLDLMARGEAYEYEYYANASFAEALAKSDSFDVIHSHLGPSRIPYGMLSTTPVLHTMRIALSVDDCWMLNRYPSAAASAISRSQIDPISAARRKAIRVVYNGCDFDSYKLSTDEGRYLAFLGRMCPQKNPLEAIRIAKRLGMPILLAGKPQNEGEERYFAEKITPLIDDTNIVYVGPVNLAQKVELLKNASALLFPIQWEEPFGNVMVEAMACGTPVVAWNRGSVSEVVDPGKTGFYCNSDEALATLVPLALTLDRANVRKFAMERFSHERMADEYLKVYSELLQSPVGGLGLQTRQFP
ncbi:glycosyltransferase family 4 protein [Planctomycetota bacterium]